MQEAIFFQAHVAWIIVATEYRKEERTNSDSQGLLTERGLSQERMMLSNGRGISMPGLNCGTPWDASLMGPSHSRCFHASLGDFNESDLLHSSCI